MENKILGVQLNCFEQNINLVAKYKVKYIQPAIVELHCEHLIKGGGPNLDESQNFDALNS